jgi:hypothetical protein
MTASPILISSVPVASQSSRALAFSFTQKIAIATCLITGKCAHLDAERGVPPRQWLNVPACRSIPGSTTRHCRYTGCMAASASSRCRCAHCRAGGFGKFAPTFRDGSGDHPVNICPERKSQPICGRCADHQRNARICEGQICSDADRRDGNEKRGQQSDRKIHTYAQSRDAKQAIRKRCMRAKIAPRSPHRRGR